MNSFQFALKEVKKHIIRTIVTVVLFAASLGAISFAIAYPLCDIEGNYVKTLEKSGIKSLQFSFDPKVNHMDKLQELVPKGQAMYPVLKALSQIGTRQTVYNFKTEEELSACGFSMLEGRLPTSNDEVAISEDMYRELQEKGISVLVTYNLDVEIRHFSTFAEAQEIFKTRNPYSPHYDEIISNINLTGVVKTGYNFEYAARLKSLIAEGDKNVVTYKRELQLYEQSTASHAAFKLTDSVNNSKITAFITAVPAQKAEARQMFKNLRQELEKRHWNRQFNLGQQCEVYSISGLSYEKDFSDVIQKSCSMMLILLPIGLVFLIISILMMLSLESMCIKSSREEIGTMRALGTRHAKIYGISLWRSLFVGLLAFAVSIPIAFVMQNLMGSSGTFSYYRYGIGTADGGAYPVLNIFAFLVTLGLATIISVVGSALAYARYLRKTPAEIFLQNKG